MAKLPAIFLFTGDWLGDPRLSLCAPATRGVWIDLLCAMHRGDCSGELRGTDDQLARIARCSTVEFIAARTDLQTTETAGVTERNGVVTITNHRMKREAEARKANNDRLTRWRSKRGGGSETEDETLLKQKSNAPYSYSPSSSHSGEDEGKGGSGGKTSDAPSRAKRAPRPKKEEITLNRETWKWEPKDLIAASIERWKPAYPAVDILGELRRMIDWVKTNPAKGQKSAWERFIVGWLRRAQDRGGSRPEGGRFQERANGNGVGKPMVAPRREPDWESDPPAEMLPDEPMSDEDALEARIRSEHPPGMHEDHGSYEGRIRRMLKAARGNGRAS